jgi:hypothetical protein
MWLDCGRGWREIEGIGLSLLNTLSGKYGLVLLSARVPYALVKETTDDPS